jgi:hypothetical protein
MNDTKSRSERKRPFRWAALIVLLVLFAGAAIVYATQMKGTRGGTPKLVNRPTAAREVRPLSEKTDKRFAPLPIEREKHEK